MIKVLLNIGWKTCSAIPLKVFIGKKVYHVYLKYCLYREQFLILMMMNQTDVNKSQVFSNDYFFDVIIWVL